MNEKRYFKIEYDEEWYLFDSTTISEQLVKEQAEYGYGVFANSLSPSEICDLLNNLHQENEQLKKQLNPKISIFNKDKGEWKWNDNNDIILNIRNGKSFYLRSSGAVENLVALLNEQQEKSDKLERQLRKAMIHIVSDTCSLSEAKLREVIDEIKNA